ncbi:AraC family transcriptional regulator [Hoeflea sp. TYP-13]|uniref:AraC family transcriptional regulator n=1 Tax=Hoeflea sp. TYP-13 TaxID=3230023 RepID=UPI0034C6B869
MKNTDILSEVFETLRLTSDIYFKTDFRGEFAVEIPPERRRIRFHLVQGGDCWIRVPGTDPARLTEGDLAIVPYGMEQILSKTPHTHPVPLPDIMGALANGVLPHGTGSGSTRLICGYCRFDEDIDHPVLTSLPPLVLIRAADLGAEPWAATTLRLMSLEGNLGAQGMSGILSRLLEIVLIQSVRRLTPKTGRADAGFMAALADARLSRALNAMHSEPHRAWTVSGLARVAGMSRGRFAHLFTDIVGSPPIDYLTTWRLIKARALLANTGLDMAEIAQRCGYKSVPSFSRRFKLMFGVGPGSFRRSPEDRSVTPL